MGDKLPVERGFFFFKKKTICKYVEERHILQIWKCSSILPKNMQLASLQKLRSIYITLCQTNYAKKAFLMFYVRTYDTVMRISKSLI